MLKTKLSLLLVVVLLVPTTWAEEAKQAPVKGAPVTLLQIDEDLKELLISKEDLKSEIQKERRSLLMTAIEFGKADAFFAVAVATIVTFLVSKEPLKLIGLYATNGLRMYKAWRTGRTIESVAKVKMIEDSAIISTAGVGLGLSAGFVYLGTDIYLQGGCLFSCLDGIASRATDRQEMEFLSSPTFKAMESEIGHGRAIQFMSILKQIRASSYGNIDPFTIMGRFLNGMNGKALTSIEEFEMPQAPTFVAVVKALNEAYMLDSIVYNYLYATGHKS